MLLKQKKVQVRSKFKTLILEWRQTSIKLFAFDWEDELRYRTDSLYVLLPLKSKISKYISIVSRGNWIKE